MGSCTRYDQVDDLPSLIAEIQDKLERLRSIRKSERDIDWCDHALPSLRQEHPTEKEILYPSPSKEQVPVVK